MLKKDSLSRKTFLSFFFFFNDNFLPNTVATYIMMTRIVTNHKKSIVSEVNKNKRIRKINAFGQEIWNFHHNPNDCSQFLGH